MVAKPAEPAVVQQEVINEHVEKEVEIEVVEQGNREDVVLVTAEKPSVDDEAEGKPLGGSAEEEGTQEVSIQGMTNNVPRTQLAQVTLEDETLEPLRKLAVAEKEGYYFSREYFSEQGWIRLLRRESKSACQNSIGKDV